jgi:hypothetical protein
VSSARPEPRLARRALASCAVGLLLVLLPGLATGDVWPQPPRAAAVSLSSLSPADAHDYRFAAGFYQALTRELGAGDTGRLDAREANLLGRALLSLGEGASANRLLGRRRDLPPSLGLLLALTVKPSAWSALERDRWRAAFPGEDAESLYWDARLAQAMGERERARQRLSELVRREPGAVFAPAALELLQALPGPAPLASGPGAARAAGGLRVQWGVFREAQGARRLLDAVLAYGQPAELLRGLAQGEELYRVCSPALATEAEARALGEQVRLRYGLDFVLYRPAQDDDEEPGARR